MQIVTKYPDYVACHVQRYYLQHTCGLKLNTVEGYAREDTLIAWLHPRWRLQIVVAAGEATNKTSNHIPKWVTSVRRLLSYNHSLI
jgi:hypothetical protein